MDVRPVRLPNGTVIENVPVGTTQAQLIEQLRASGYDVSQFSGELNEGIPASRVTVAEAIPFISNESRQAISQKIRELRAGATQAAMTPLQLAGASKLGLLPERGAATETYLRQEFGADPSTFTGQTGRFGAELAMGVPIIRGAGTLIGKASPALGQSVETAGFNIPATAEGAKGIGLRMAGGGIGAFAGTLPFNPEDAILGGTLGSVIAPVARAALAGGRTLKDLVVSSPQQLAENALLEAGGADLRNALIRTQGMKTTPGYTPSVLERAVEGGVDNLELAALQNRIRLAPKAAQIQADSISKNMGYLQSQLSRIEGQLAQDITQLSPGDATRLSEVRNNLQRQLAAEEQNFNALIQSLPQQLPPNVAAAAGEAPGEVLQARASELRRRARAAYVEPAYRAAFNAAEGARIDVTPIADAARIALGRPLAEFAPESMPAVARVLGRLEARPVVETRVSTRGRPQRVVTGEAPPTMTLEELDALRKAINSDISMAQRSQSGLTPAQVTDLYALHRQIDNVVNNAPNLSDEAKELYGQALDVYRNRFAPAFKDNVTGMLLKDTTFGRTQIMPSDAVTAYLAQPQFTRQFLDTFGQDPQARAAFTTGVEDLFRQQAVDLKTKLMNPDAAAKFLEKNAPQLQILESAGIPIRQRLASIQTEAARLNEGLANVQSLRTIFGGETAQDVVQTLLSSPSNMKAALGRLSPDGREAVQSAIVTRVTNMLSGDKPNVGGAVKLLADNSASIKQVMGKDGFADLEAIVARTGDLQKVSASLVRAMPDARVVPKVQQLTGNFTQEELTDLAAVAADIARFQRGEGLATLGIAAPRPAAQRLASEAAEQTSPVAGYSTLNQEVNLALRISQNLRQRINNRAANELAVLMHQKPDQALEAINAALARKERRTMFSGAAGRQTAIVAPQVAQPFVDFREQR
jgi:hypothetical protein